MPSTRSTVLAAAALLLVLAGCDGNRSQPEASASLAPYTPAVGTCFDYETRRGPQDTVPCAGEHRFEVAYVGQVTDTSDAPPLPSSAAVRSAYQECSGQVDKYLGGASRALMVNIEVGFPGLAAWQAGSHWFSCDLAKETVALTADASGEESVTGSVKDSYGNPSSSIRMPCFNATRHADGALADWKPVSCSAEHTLELVGLVNSTSKAEQRPVSDDKLYDRCFDLIAAYTKVSRRDEHRYGIRCATYYPPRLQWKMGERAVRCFIYLAKGAVSRSLAGAGPSAL